jgi:hypothetical protein
MKLEDHETKKKKTWEMCCAKKSIGKHHEGEEEWSLYPTQISQTLESSNSPEA